MNFPALSQFATVAEYKAASAEYKAASAAATQPKFSTKQAQPELGRNGKWSAAFENWVERGNDKYMSSSCTSAPVFDTAADADEGGKRALATLESTGKFPNLCEKF